MGKDTKYPLTLAALASVEGTVWSVADALAIEIVASKSGIAKKGQYEAITKDAAARGFVNPTTGQPYTTQWLGDLREAGLFVRLEPNLRRYPVKRVLAAKTKAGHDPGRTLELLSGGQTMHEIAGTSSLGRGTPVIKTKEQAQAMVRAASPEARKAMVEEAIVDPDVARELAVEGNLQEALIEAKLDEGYRRATGKPVRPKGAPQENEEPGALRPGLAYLAIVTPLYRSRLNVIEAMGHARESEITDELNKLVMDSVEALRELLVDFQLLLDGEREITDDDISAFLRAAEEDKERR